MRLLLTRPREDAEGSAEALRALGHEVEIEPLLTIRLRREALDPARDLAGVQALAITSLNGLRAYLAAQGPRELPVFAVGPASAAAARAAGFTEVRSAEGDALALAALILASLDPAAGALLHPAGTVSAGGLSERLGAAGFELRRLVLYEAVPAERLSERTQQRLGERAFEGALFYSPRTAATFVSLVRAAGLEACCTGLSAYCLSPAVAAALEPLGLRRLRVATEPHEAALFQAVQADRHRGSEDMADNDEAASDGADEAANRAQGVPEAANGTATERLIARFGGLRPMAGKLGIAVSTVQGWKTRGHIPPTRTEEIRKAAREHGLELDEDELAAATAEQPSATEPVEAPLEGEHVSGPSPWGAPAAAAAAAPEATTHSDARPRDASPAEDEALEAARPAARTERPAGRSRTGAWIGGLVLGALLVVGGAAAAVFTQPYWQPYLGDLVPGAGSRLENEVEPRLEPLRERLAALESAPAAPEANTAALERELESLREQVSALREQGVAAGGEAAPDAGPELEALRERLGALEGQVESAGGGEQAAERLAALDRRVGELSDSLAAAGADPQALENFRGEVARLSARFDDLGGTIEQLRQGLARIDAVQDRQGAVDGRLEDLSGQLDRLREAGAENRGRLEQQVAAIRQAGDARDRGALLALALGQLREALRFSEPYEEELQGVQAVADATELGGEFEALQAGAESGVPNLTALRRRFSELAPEIVGTSYASGEQGWLREVMERVPELVTVRPVGQATGESVGAKVARAERALGDGDLPAAVAEVESLEGEAAEIAAPWLAEARSRLAADAALSDLTRRAITQLSGTPRGEAQPQEPAAQEPAAQEPGAQEPAAEEPAPDEPAAGTAPSGTEG